MQRVVEDLVGLSGLGDPAAVHDKHPVGDFRDDGEVVGDQQQRDIGFVDQFDEQVEDLALYRGVERGGRLIRDNEIGFAGKGHGDDDALSLSAGELVGIGPEPAFGIVDPDAVQQACRLGPGFELGHLGVEKQRLHHLVADGFHRVEGCHRLLEDHGNAIAAEGAHLGFGPRQKIVS